MNSDQFRLALSLLKPSDWEHFERLCSMFLSTDYPNLRITAFPGGDGGRDSELFLADKNDRGLRVVAQYSVSKDWKRKIKSTVQRLLSNRNHNIHAIIFMSNQVIGASADTLIRDVLNVYDVHIDIRDLNWFIMKMFVNKTTNLAAEELVDKILLPHLQSEKIIERPSSPLSNSEAKAAILYLSLQLRDNASGKGLTKVSFDALVRAALRNTDSSRRSSRAEIYTYIQRMLPSADANRVKQHVDAALHRLNKVYIRHWRKEDSFCLTHDESNRVAEKLAEIKTEESQFHSELSTVIHQYIDSSLEDYIEDLLRRIPRILEQLFLKQGEEYVHAVITGDIENVEISEDIKDIIYKDIQLHTAPRTIAAKMTPLISNIISALLSDASTATLRYLSRLASSYTLFAFLNQTPNVQKATRKLFSHGTIWLDTSVLLPLLAEELSDAEDGSLTKIFRLLATSGVQLRVTSGIMEELVSHIHKSLTCSRTPTSEWKGPVPYLYRKYTIAGKSPAQFGRWLELFIGNIMPLEDMEGYLLEEHRVKREDLHKYRNMVNKQLAAVAKELWTDAHKKRRKTTPIEDETTEQLIEHDLETYLGVLGKRSSEKLNELSYKHWLMTFDRVAWSIHGKLRQEFPRNLRSPLLSLVYLVNSISFGPMRENSEEATLNSFPLILDIELSEPNSIDILKVAEQVRIEYSGRPERVIRREIRDKLFKLKQANSLRDEESVLGSIEGES